MLFEQRKTFRRFRDETFISRPLLLVSCVIEIGFLNKTQDFRAGRTWMKAEKNNVYLENLKLVFDEPGMIHVATTLGFSY